MKDYDIKPNTGFSGSESGVSPFGGENENTPLDIEETAKIDALIRRTAEIYSVSVDFEKIKRNILASDKKRRRRRKFFSSLAAAAAACIFAFSVTAAVKVSLGGKINPPHTAAVNSDEPMKSLTPSPKPLNPNQHEQTVVPSITDLGYDACEYKGVSENAGEAVKQIYEIFKRKLPDYMNIGKRNAEGFGAEGKDAYGNSKRCDCAVISEPPYKLKAGQLGALYSVGADISRRIEYYWQINGTDCLRISFFGFGEKEARSLIRGVGALHR